MNIILLYTGQYSFQINTHSDTLTFKFLQGYISQEVGGYRFQGLGGGFSFCFFQVVSLGKRISIGLRYTTLHSLDRKREGLFPLWGQCRILEVLCRTVWQVSQAYLHLQWESEIFLQLQTPQNDKTHATLEIYLL